MDYEKKIEHLWKRVDSLQPSVTNPEDWDFRMFVCDALMIMLQLLMDQREDK